MPSPFLAYAQTLLTVLVAAGFFIATAGLTLFTLLMFPYKLLVQLLAKSFRPDLDHMVTGGWNVLFALGAPKRPMANLCVLAVIDGTVNVGHLRHTFQTRVLNYKENGVWVYKKLKQSVTQFMGYPFSRTDENFEIQNHIRRYDYTEDGLALPNSDQVTQEDLEERLSQLLALPWKSQQSNWEMLVIGNYYKSGTEAEKQTVVLFRINHAIGDGHSLQNVFFRFMQITEPEVIGTRKLNVPRKSIVSKLKIGAQFPFKLFYDMAELSLELLWAHRGWACAGKKQMAASAFSSTIPVDDIKAIKNKMGVSYMAVLLAAVCAAVGRLVSVQGQGPKAQKIVCSIPLPKLRHPTGLTNHFYGGALPLPFVQQATKSVVGEVQRSMSKLSKSNAVFGLDLLLELGSSLPTFLFQLAHRFYAPDVVMSVCPVANDTYCWEGSKISQLIISGATASISQPIGATVYLNGMGGMQQVSIVVNKKSSTFSSCDEKLHKFSSYVKEEIRNLLKEN